jgi:putative transposase
MCYALLVEGFPASEQRIARLMKLHQIQATVRRRWRPRTAAGAAKHTTNLFADTSIQRPNQAWVTDMTYLKTQQGWAYLATVIDAHTRQSVG